MNRRVRTMATWTASLAMIGPAPALWARQSDSAEEVLRPVISEDVAPVEAIAPVASDGHVGEAFLRKPPGEGPFPVVVLIHGGSPGWPRGQLREFALHTHASRFLEAGYVVTSITRRDLDLNLPFGEEQESVKDTLAVIDYLKDLAYVDSESIVLRGTSVGGYLALEGGAAREVAAIVVEEPYSFPFVGVSGGRGANASPNLEKIRRLKSPILLVRGDQTPNINVFNRDVFIPALRSAGRLLEVLTYPGELHSFAFYNNSERTPRPAVALEAFTEIDRFFRQHVRTQPSPFDPALVEHVPVD